MTINHNTVGKLTLTGKEFTFPFGQGKEAAEGIGKVRWVQLWENGPKFAEYNVGATSATEYGGYYTWGGTYKNGKGIAWSDDHNKGSVALTGTDDTATKLWGSKWRMPTSAELSDAEGGLLHECDCVWTTNYNGTGKNGLLCTGKGAYSSNSVFLPAAGYCDNGGVHVQGSEGFYWSSTADGVYQYYSYYLNFDSSGQKKLLYGSIDRGYGYSVRAVLAED